MSPVDHIIKKTHQGVEHIDDTRQKRFARDNAGFLGMVRALFGSFEPRDFRTIIQGKQQMRSDELRKKKEP